MPNESLIGQVDMLRETYGQQQKAASALLTALKAVTDSQSKAQRVLRDFSAQNGALDVGAVQSAFAQTRLKEETIDPLLPDLRRELKNLAALIGALKEAAGALRSQPVAVVNLDKAIARLQTMRQPDVADLLPELNAELDLAQRSLGDEFGARLRAALAEEGIALGGRPPRFEIGRFELEANFARRVLVLRYGKDVVVPHVPITVDATVRAYQTAAKAIAGRTQDGKAWLAQFYDAYQNAGRKRAGSGGRVNIVESYVEMVILRQGRAFASEPSKRSFTDYLRAQFIYDFYEFAAHRRLAHNDLLVKAHVSTKSQTENPTKSMWIVEGDGPYDGRYFADVEFVKE